MRKTLRLVQPEKPSNSIDGNYPSRQGKTWLRARIPAEKKARIAKWCRNHKITQQEATELLWDDMLARGVVEPMPLELSPAQAIRFALDYYARWTGNPVNQRDQDAASCVVEIEFPIVQMGILYSIIRNMDAPGSSPIKTFKYCIGAIQEWNATKHEMSPDFIRLFLVPHHEKKLQRLRESESCPQNSRS